MTVSKRLAFAVSASVLVFGLGFAPCANAEDAMMSKTAVHKHMKKHKAGMMKGDAMKGDAMAK